MGCSPSDAEDTVQAALLRCLLHWDKVERAGDPDAYVRRILVNTLTSSRRRMWSRERAVEKPPEQSTPDPFGEIDVADSVQRGLLRLPTDQRAAVVLRYYLHLTEAQMAATLDVPPGTVKSRLSRALTALGSDPNIAELRGAP
jgi:RNA polymerase sigma-70 factor (sigma-E family)